MSEMQHRSRRRHRQDCAFGYLTVAPIDGHLEARHATEIDARVDPYPPGDVDGSTRNKTAVVVVRRLQRRKADIVEGSPR